MSGSKYLLDSALRSVRNLEPAMSHHRQEFSDSDSDDRDYYSAEDAGSDIEIMQEDREMDWEPSRSTVSVPCRVNDKEPTSNPLLCANAALYMTGIQNARALRFLVARGTLHVC